MRFRDDVDIALLKVSGWFSAKISKLISEALLSFQRTFSSKLFIHSFTPIDCMRRSVAWIAQRMTALDVVWGDTAAAVPKTPSHSKLNISRQFATHGVSSHSDRDQSTMIKFYKSVDVKETSDGSGYELWFDNKYALKSPAKKPFVLPTKYLAHGIAAEWDCQSNRIDPETMPLMSLAATAIDQPQAPETVAATLCTFLPTDPVLCRMDDSVDPVLKERQEILMHPFLEYVNERLKCSLSPSMSILGAQVSRTDTVKIHQYILGLSKWERSALEQLSSSCKSVCMAIGGVEGVFTADALIEASRVEEDFQIEQWGLVEGGHDIDIADIRVRVSAPLVFLDLLKTR
jgi:ATP synthase F1 complex assembly factor 2